ncbi:DUF2306 domain-containing protein [Rhodococcus qingshengii]|uniref:DUF2306 domain-containing protein n=1 Tax=Rhodococcus qingshengii TaxID=334542 RepID=UPI0035FA8FFF
MTTPARPPGRTTRRWAHFGYIFLGLVVAFYAPLAFSYFLNGPANVRPQDHVLEFLVSPAFAFGVGSVNDGHLETYVATYAAMWLHTVVGTLILVTGFLQFSTRLRTRHSALHRTLGKAFLIGALIVSATAVVYLVKTPAEKVFSGWAFSEVLWLLAIGTTTSAVLAFVAIRRRDVVAHQQYVALTYALVCSAPLLRIGWITVGQFWGTKEMINLTEGAWAGPFLITCAIAYTRLNDTGRSRGASAMVSGRVLRLAGAAATIGTVALVVVASRTTWDSWTPEWFTPGWWPLIIFALAPYLAQTILFAALARRAATRGDLSAQNTWRTYLVGNLAAPAVGAVILAFAVAAHGAPLTNAWYAAPLGWNLSLFFAYIVHTALTTRFARPLIDKIRIPIAGNPMGA